jgi:hypothetical protein
VKGKATPGDYRKAAIVLLSVLAVLTILFCLPYALRGPFRATGLVLRHKGRIGD